MRVKFIKAYGLSNPGDVIDAQPHDVGRILIMRGVAVAVDDPDGDGKAESGKEGVKKAFSQPPATKQNKFGKK